ncbi:hypothetical protein THAOC_07033 [Thalassiosira oceanica]|uniref:PKD domain-containing protein n=1 Tax=Thalassiosira oceanica TaxID=159749 RepID=K0SYM6_THAOC|nr:hypothetical protein THAOC_07033 [Thalassiosira oceanica]|eukprot:EJK71518.1 hypothetical protein THAOC_07033 [Thalassiosira oceanica]
MAPDGAADDWFGEIVDIHEDTIVIGAYGESDNGEVGGSAHVFVRSGNEWNHQDKLLSPDRAADDSFESSVTIYGDTIVVGAPLDDDNGFHSGSAHVFVRSGEGWKHQAKLLSSEGAAVDFFRVSAAIYEDTIVVCAYGDDDNGGLSGTAQVFVRSGEEWTLQVKLLAPDGLNFGLSVAIYGDTIVFGTYGVDNGNYSGSAQIFVV